MSACALLRRRSDCSKVLIVIGSSQQKFACEEGFGVTLPAFHAAKARQAAEGFFVEPGFRTLRAEMAMQEFDLAAQDFLAEFDIEVRLAQIAIPFRNFVFEDELIAEGVPGELTEEPMILVRILARMGHNHVGFQAL